MWIASSHGHEAVIHVLLATDAVDVNVLSVPGRTPLFWAAAGGHSEVVEFLLNHGAKQNYTDKAGRSRVSVARADVIYILTEDDLPEHGRRGYVGNPGQRSRTGRKRPQGRILLWNHLFIRRKSSSNLSRKRSNSITSTTHSDQKSRE